MHRLWSRNSSLVRAENAVADAETPAPTFGLLDPASDQSSVALRLIAGRDGVYRASGTATMITTNLAITAAHNIVDYWDCFEEPQELHRQAGEYFRPQLLGSFHIIAAQTHNNETHSYEVRKIVMCTWTDIALLSLTPRDERSALDRSAPLLTLIPPGLEEEIFGFGFANTTATMSGDNVEVQGELFATLGVVQEVHWQMRDAARLTFPCFRTDARFDGSMSGGPVLDSRGRLCGIICSNMPPSSPTESHISYVALLYPLMGLEFMASKNGGQPQKVTLLDILRGDLEGAEGISFARGTNKQGIANSIVGIEFRADVAHRFQNLPNG